MNSQRNSDNARKELSKEHSLNAQRNQIELNPCYKEQLLSLKCLDSNQNQHNKCEVYFMNYKNCKEFWSAIEIERRSKGIKPYLPPLNERTKIKAERFNI
ncbi:hypothetical protein HN011_011146 [Eciton burchellii]|nr:hypothetical protein HN011_011146 [Eciton burchellii]